MPTKRLIATFTILTLSIVLMVPALGSQAQGVAPVGAANRLLAGRTCQDILTNAMNAIQTTCDELGRNKACYGNNKITVEANNGATLKFDAIGDRAAIQDIRTLTTLPLNVSEGTWGLSLLKIQANLPDSLPGQNITFLVFGDTAIENASGDMSAFYFTSGLGNLDCKEAPRDGILIRSPHHTEVTFTANGVQISIASTVLLRAERGKSMSVQLIEGHARLTTPDGTQVLQPGEVSTVALGGNNGLTAVGAPSLPKQSNPNSTLDPAVTTTQEVGDADAPINVSIDGCITEVKGNFVTVDDYQINVGSNRDLKAANVGDCFHLDGQIKSNKGNGVSFILIKANKRNNQGNADNAHSNNGNNGKNDKGANGNNAGGNGNANGNNAGGNGNAGGGKKK